MKRSRLLCILGVAATLAAQQPESPFPPDEMAKGIALGKQFATRKQFIETGLKENRIKVDGTLARDAIRKYVTFYRDYHVVAARVAEANQQLREVSEKDLSVIPHTGLLFARLDLHAIGPKPPLGSDRPFRRLTQRFTDGSTRMVLQIDGLNIQPAKEGFFPRPEKKTCVGQYYTYSIFAIYNFGLGSGSVNQVSWDCTDLLADFSVEFGFLLTLEQRRKKALVIIVDSEGHRYSAPVDLSMLR